jgi:hypothetical protein
MLYIYTYIAFAIFLLLYQFLERTHVMMMVVGGGELVPNKMGCSNQCSFFQFFLMLLKWQSP